MHKLILFKSRRQFVILRRSYVPPLELQMTFEFKCYYNFFEKMKKKT